MQMSICKAVPKELRGHMNVAFVSPLESDLNKLESDRWLSTRFALSEPYAPKNYGTLVST